MRTVSVQMTLADDDLWNIVRAEAARDGKSVQRFLADALPGVVEAAQAARKARFDAKNEAFRTAVRRTRGK